MQSFLSVPFLGVITFCHLIPQTPSLGSLATLSTFRITVAYIYAPTLHAHVCACLHTQTHLLNFILATEMGVSSRKLSIDFWFGS